MVLACVSNKPLYYCMHTNVKCKLSCTVATYSQLFQNLLFHTMQTLALQGRFSELVEMLPTNCYSTVCKLRKMSSTQFSDVDEMTHGTLSECDDAKVINNHLITYIMNKCTDDVVLLCSVLENVVSSDKKKQLQDLGIILCRL